MISQDLKDEIKKFALQNPMEECCGLILISGDSTTVLKCRNVSSNKQRHFEISALDYLRAQNDGKNKIIGFWHTQYSPNPSMLDILNYKNHKVPSYIYSFEKNEVFEITDQYLKYGKYLGLIFELGRTDCFSLVRSFYKQEKDIEIYDYPRKDGWFKENPNIIKDSYSKEGFIKIDFKDIIEGDLIEFLGYHFGIYLEGDLILQHERNKLSTINILTNDLKNKITNIYRHNG